MQYLLFFLDKNTDVKKGITLYFGVKLSCVCLMFAYRKK